MNNSYLARITPAHIISLRPTEVFVFGSNLAGMHGSGAARMARLHFGAVVGQGDGPKGQSYAIPTMQGGPQTIAPYVDKFIAYAKAHPTLTFLVTPIGCGIAGFLPNDIAPLFKAAVAEENIHLPQCFWDVLLASPQPAAAVSSSPREVRVEAGDKDGRVWVVEGGEPVGELHFSVRGQVLSIDHTHTYKGHEGKGIASLLVQAANDYAADRGLKVLPVCSYAWVWYQRHPQYSHLLDEHAGEGVSCRIR